MKNVFVSLLYIYLLSGSSYGIGSSIECRNSINFTNDLSFFEKITEGKILFDLYISDSEEAQIINIFSITEGVEEIVFSIPVISGNKLDPQEITSRNSHRFEIEFDLRYNFSKVFIDGNWLTSILAKKQYYFINGINIERSSINNEGFNLKNLHTEGTILEFKTPIKIVAFGNSTTAYRNTITGVYCQRIPEYFQKQNIPVHVFNEGIGGSHTGHLSDNAQYKIRHALDRFDDTVIAKEPDFVIIDFGINDSWVDSDNPKGQSTIPLVKFKENLHYMINALKRNDITVILMTPNALGKNIELWRHQRTVKYVKAIRDIAKKEKLPFIDQWKLMNKCATLQGRQIDDFLLPDGMHPNDLWHKISAETISELIIDLINKSDAY
jgi:lysophospholipase L1-like esterase